MQGKQTNQGGKMLVLSNSQENFELLRDILNHYFPQKIEGLLHIETKYYSTNIEVTRRSWPLLPQLQQFLPQTSQQQPTELDSPDKQDLLVMLVSPQQSFPPQLYDSVIQYFNPDNFIVLLNLQQTQSKWKDEEVVSTEVNNFLQVIRENLAQLKANPPERPKKGLLTDSYEDESIFSLLQLMQTTQWSHIQKLQSDKASKAKAQSTPKKQKQTKIENTQQAQAQSYQKEQKQEQLNEEQLEQQMNNFETLMWEMHNMRKVTEEAQNVSHEQRKKTAENLINKLLSGSFM